MKVTQKTSYPLNGKIQITAEGTDEVRIRIPSWCEKWTSDREYFMDKGYAVFYGDGQIFIEFEMKPVLMQSSIKVYGNLDTVAVQFGPIVYCAEAIDNCGDVHSLYINSLNPNWKAEKCDRCGCLHFTVEGYRRKDTENKLYYPLDESFEKTEIKLIPYYEFANREESDMLVFLRYR